MTYKFNLNQMFMFKFGLYIDSTTYVRIPASTDGYPRSHIRAKDCDFYVNHFSSWWIVAVINKYFVGKRVNCTPYVQLPVKTGLTHLVLLRINDDLVDVVKVRKR